MRAFIPTAVSLALLVACEGGSGPLQRFDNFDQLVAAADDMAAGTVDLDSGALLPGVTPTDPADLPATGSATYDGYVSGDMGGDRMIGELAMTTTFDTPTTVTGTVDGFVHEAYGAYAGTLNISGFLQPGGPSQIVGSADGTLQNGGVSFPTQILLFGNFVGTNHGTVAGSANGTVGAEAFDGGFVAER